MTATERAQHMAAIFRNEDPDGTIFGRIFRDAFDQAYDGQHTGRYSIDMISKTEKSNIGSIVEIIIRRVFNNLIDDGVQMDYSVNGIDIDCKYSMMPFKWMIPNETLGHLALVCTADDKKALYSVGVVDVCDEILGTGRNRDQKRTIKASARDSIEWVHFEAPIPPNTLLQLSSEDREAVLSPKGGAERLAELFRRSLNTRIPRGIVATVARQKDYMKRVRYNGGCRSILQPEGIAVLGDYGLHQQMARQLGLPVPVNGDFVAARLTQNVEDKGSVRPHIAIGPTRLALARPGDPIGSIPKIPFS